MRYDIIKTEKYILVCDDSEIRMGDWYLTFTNREVMGEPRKCEDTNWNFTHCKKIIVHLPLNGAPVLEGVPLLPRLPKEDDVDYWIHETVSSLKDEHTIKTSSICLKAGYNKAKEKYKYTEEDLRDAIRMAQEQELVKYTDNEYRYTHSEMDIIKSLQQLKYPIAFECDMKQRFERDKSKRENPDNGVYYTPKTTINHEGRVEWTGTYIWQ